MLIRLSWCRQCCLYPRGWWLLTCEFAPSAVTTHWLKHQQTSFFVLVQTAERKNINVMLFDTWLESNRYMRKILLWYDWTTKQNFVCVIVNNLRIFTCINHKINKVESPKAVFSVWGRLRWTHTNQLPRQERVRDRFTACSEYRPGGRHGTRKTERLSCV